MISSICWVALDLGAVVGLLRLIGCCLVSRSSFFVVEGHENSAAIVVF